MKYAIIFLFSLRSVLLAYEVKITVVDDAGAPAKGAQVSVLFVHPRGSDRHNGFTDWNGSFSATGRAIIGVMVWASKGGHYSSKIENLSAKQNHDIEVVLPRILNPASMYGWNSDLDRSVRFPAQSQWVGFDFEVADWVAPHGRGKVSDILCRFKNEFKGWQDRFEDTQHLERVMAASKEVYAARKEEWTMDKFKVSAGKWDGVLEISFPGEGEGLFEEKKFLPYCQLKMPHSAPVDGYVPSWHYTSNNYSPRTYRKDVGFFLRTRVKLDKEGKVISANYAKIYGDFQLDAERGLVDFIYYFNPVPNDRNLEFDPKQNLFPKDKPGANVYDP